MWISKTKIERKITNKRKNAKQRRLICTLSLADLLVIFERNGGVCDYTGKPFDEYDPYLACSIERIDSNRGYEVGNICLVSVQANRVKDEVFDRVEQKDIKISKEFISILSAISVKVTPEYMKFLGQKYDPRIIYDPQTDPYKDYFKDLTGDKIVSNISPIEQKPILEVLDMSEQWTEEQKAENVMPDDVHIATYYSALAGAAKKSGLGFTLSYAQFKGRLARKTCTFSGKNLDLTDKFVVLRDNKKALSAENIIVVDEKFGHKLNKLSEEMGLSVDELAKMFKRLT